MIIFPLMIDKDDSSEVFWFYYDGKLYSRVTESLAKNHPCYKFKNESDYFSAKIIDLISSHKNKEDRIISAMEKAMKDIIKQ